MADWIARILDTLGPVGVGLLVAMENIVPPIPSEVVLPLAGFRAREGAMHVVAVWTAATVGALAGALALYGLGAWLGYRRLYDLAGRRWFVLASQRDVERGSELFDRYGGWAVALGRCVPVVRSLVSLPAGMRGMPLGRYCLLTTLGAGVWNAAFVAAGWYLAERWHSVDRYVGWAGMLVLGLLVVGVGVLAWRRHTGDRLPVG